MAGAALGLVLVALASAPVTSQGRGAALRQGSGQAQERPRREGTGATTAERQAEHGGRVGQHPAGGRHQQGDSRIREGAALHGLGQGQVGGLRHVHADQRGLRGQLPALRHVALALRAAPAANHARQRSSGDAVRAELDVSPRADRRPAVHQGPAAVVVRRVGRDDGTATRWWSRPST